MTIDAAHLAQMVRDLGAERETAQAQLSAESVVLKGVRRELAETRTQLARVQDAHRQLEQWTREERANLCGQVERLQGELDRERDAHRRCQEARTAETRRFKEVTDQIKGIGLALGVAP